MSSFESVNARLFQALRATSIAFSPSVIPTSWVPGILPFPCLAFPRGDFLLLENALRHILAAQRKVLLHLHTVHTTAHICDLLAIPQMAREHIDWDVITGGHPLVGRADIVQSLSGQYYFCEFPGGHPKCTSGGRLKTYQGSVATFGLKVYHR